MKKTMAQAAFSGMQRKNKPGNDTMPVKQAMAQAKKGPGFLKKKQG